MSVQAQMDPDAYFQLEVFGSPRNGFVVTALLVNGGRETEIAKVVHTSMGEHDRKMPHLEWLVTSAAAFHHKRVRIIHHGWPSIHGESFGARPATEEERPAPGDRVPLKSDPLKQDKVPDAGRPRPPQQRDNRGPLTGERDWF